MGLLKSSLNGVGKISKALAQNQQLINRHLQIVNESLELCRTSKNPETRISRMGVACDNLSFLCAEYPYWPELPHWKKQYERLALDFPAFLVGNLSIFITDDITKIEKLKSQSACHNRAEKLVEKLTPYLGHPACDTDWLVTQIYLIKKAYPKQGDTPEKKETIPTHWKPQNSPGTTVSRINDRTYATMVGGREFKKVSTWGKIGIGFCWLMLFSPAIQMAPPYNTIGLIASIILTVATVKWIHKSRKEKSERA